MLEFANANNIQTNKSEVNESEMIDNESVSVHESSQKSVINDRSSTSKVQT